MPIAAGQLREYLEIERKSTVVQPDGSETVTWATVLTTHAAMKMSSGGLDVIASQDNISQVFTFLIRYRTDVVIQIDDRLLWRGRNMKLTKIDFDVLRTQITLTCRTDNESTSPGIDPGS